MIASMIEREAGIAKDRPLIAAVIYNRLKDGMPLGIDATLRYELSNWDQPAEGLRARARLALQHAQARRPAADADRQPRPGLDRGGGAPGQGRLPVLRRQAVRQRRAHLQLDRRRSSSATSPPTTPSATSSAARAPSPASSRCALRRPRLAGRPQPLAGDVRARSASPTSCCRSRPSCSPRPSGRWPAAGFAGANVTIPHKEAALALADAPTERAPRRSARPTR